MKIYFMSLKTSNTPLINMHKGYEAAQDIPCF